MKSCSCARRFPPAYERCLLPAPAIPYKSFANARLQAKRELPKPRAPVLKRGFCKIRESSSKDQDLAPSPGRMRSCWMPVKEFFA